jgi:hypothetical protein
VRTIPDLIRDPADLLTYTAVAKLLQPEGIVAAAALQSLSMLSHRD